MKKAFMWMASVVLLLSLVLGGCGSQPTSEPTQAPEASEAPEETSPPQESEGSEVTEYKESPYLKDKGLPPVEERLPKEPMVARSMPESQIQYEIGSYGGTLRSASHTQAFDALVFCMQNDPLLESPGLLGEEIQENVLKGFEVSSDQKEFTFYMREGLKWSDGEPVTVEDVRFTVEDFLFNEELSPAGLPAFLRSGGRGDGEPFKFEVIDDYSFKMTFAEPYGGFPLTLAIEGWRGYTELIKPAHYLKPYHKKYNTDEADLEAKIEEAGFQPGEWVNLFNYKDILNWECTGHDAAGFPALTPWIQVKATDTMVEYERNPYYFKIDEEGNQLPYIDKVTTVYTQDLETLNMKVLAGEVDHSCELIPLSKLPLFKENEEKGGYKMYMPKLHRTGADVFLNFTYDDPIWRQVVRDVKFRQALNLALNRQDIVDTIYYGFAKVSTMQGDEYDVEKANQILDEMGMTKGPDGFRLGPDGKKFSIPFEVQEWRPDTIPLCELIVEQWRELGFDVSLKQIDGGLFGTRNAANEIQATVAANHGPVLWTFTDWGQGFMAPLWNQYFNTKGEQGEEPPEVAMNFFKMVESIRSLSLEEAKEMAKKTHEDMKNNLWFFILAEDIAVPTAINAKMVNYTDNGFNIAQFFGPERWFYRE